MEFQVRPPPVNSFAQELDPETMAEDVAFPRCSGCALFHATFLHSAS